MSLGILLEICIPLYHRKTTINLTSPTTKAVEATTYTKRKDRLAENT